MHVTRYLQCILIAYMAFKLMNILSYLETHLVGGGGEGGRNQFPERIRGNLINKLEILVEIPIV